MCSFLPVIDEARPVTQVVHLHLGIKKGARSDDGCDLYVNVIIIAIFGGI